jgi:phage terminase large subunit-like protein
MDDDEEWDYTEGEKAIALAEFAFSNSPIPMRLDAFQKFIIKEALKRRPDTSEFAFRQYIVSMGRQN